MRLTINIKDAKLVRQGLHNLRDHMYGIFGQVVIRIVLDKVIKRMQRYPPPRPGQRYVRTYRLKRSWKILRFGNSGYQITNNAARKGRQYARYVVGDAYGTGQAWMHQNRWPVFRDVVERAFEQAPKAIERSVHMVARRHGFSGEAA